MDTPYLLNAASNTLMAVAMIGLGLYIRDINRSPYTLTRAVISWAAAGYWLTASAAWMANAAAGGQTMFGRFVQTWGWTGRGLTGMVLVWTIMLQYRIRVIDRRERARLAGLVWE